MNLQLLLVALWLLLPVLQVAGGCALLLLLHAV
jgi:hypothetical protein